MDTIGKRLRYCREMKNITLQKMAEMMNKKSYSAIIAWEKDQAEINVSQLKQLSEILDTTEEFLLFGRTKNIIQEPTPGYSMIESAELARLRELEAEVLRKENAALKKESANLKNNPVLPSEKQ